MTDDFNLADQIRRVSEEITSAKVSVTKWGPIEDLIAEAGRVPEDDVYATTVSKPGNLKVRAEQSDHARETGWLVAMYTGDNAKLEACVSSAVQRCREQHRRFVLIFADQGNGMELVVAVKQPQESLPQALATAYPAASVIDI